MKFLAVCTVGVLILCSCGILKKEPYRDVSYFDLSSNVPKQDIGTIMLAIGGVSADSPYFERMVFRVSENRIEIDEYNRWAANPSNLIKKYFSTAFESKSDVKSAKFLLDVKILQIEANLKNNMIKLAVQITMHNSAEGIIVLEKIYSQEMAVEKVTGESFAKGVETEIGKIADELAQDIRNLQK